MTVAGNFNEKRLGRPLKINKPKVRKPKKDAKAANSKPKFSGSPGKSKTMPVERPKTKGFKAAPGGVHPHSARSVKKTKRAK